MATARWFFNEMPNSKFIIQEQLRQDYWRTGPATMWIDAVQTTKPFKAVGYWHDVNFELEWTPFEYVLLRASRKEEELIRATSLQLGFRPSRQYEEEGKYLIEWRLRPSAPAVVEPESQAAVS
jgi:hypothetical protein